MKKAVMSLLLLVVLGGFVSACGGDGDNDSDQNQCGRGSAGNDCTSTDDCMCGLECIGGICVDPYDYETDGDESSGDSITLLDTQCSSITCDVDDYGDSDNCSFICVTRCSQDHVCLDGSVDGEGLISCSGEGRTFSYSYNEEVYSHGKCPSWCSESCSLEGGADICEEFATPSSGMASWNTGTLLECLGISEDGNDEDGDYPDGDSEENQVVESLTCSDLTCTDSLTGFEWQKNPPANEMEWEEAVSYCQSLNLNGVGWRLPNISELRSLVRGCQGIELDGDCQVNDACLSCGVSAEETCLTSACDSSLCEPYECGTRICFWPEELLGNCGSYFSSSTRVKGENEENEGVDYDNYVFDLNYNDAYIGICTKGYPNYARCVR